MPKEQVLLSEIFGPVMIGPSSFHTAGVSRIAFLARKIFGTALQRAVIRFYGSLAATWKGHGSGEGMRQWPVFWVFPRRMNGFSEAAPC